MNRSDAYRLARIVELGDQLAEVIAGEKIDRAGVLGNFRVQWLVTTPLYNIGEQAYCVSAELKERYPELPWRGVAGLRHRLVHDYEGTNWSLVATVLFDELPEFVEGVRAILKSGAL